MIAVSNFRDNSSPQTDLAVEDISEFIKYPDALLWVNVLNPTQDDLDALDHEFDFHHLALEAATRTTARPEIDFYDSFLYMNFYAVHPAHQSGSIRLHMISFFVGTNFLVTVQEETLQSLDQIHQNWKRSTTETGTLGIGLLLYSILDAIVDDYFDAIDGLSDQIDQLEDEIFDGKDRSGLQQLFDIKKETMVFRRVVTPERDVLNALIRWDSPMLDRQTLLHLQDVYDHLLRVTDSLDSYRDLLGNVLEAHLSVTSNRLNQTVRTLTATTIILMGMTLVASIYGMNFTSIPELSWHWGYWWALGLMATIGIGLLVLLRRISWL